ncbi:zinc ribbon domain-containing protein [Opitutaceae bacterium TAV4]|nr:zinc ribbon domain-containing protein [Opitutaceae bacterium TAV4]
MATYIYETIPQTPTEAVETFEAIQSMNDRPLTHHPETGRPVRRVITGGFGFYGVTRVTTSPPPPPPRCERADECAAAAAESGGHCCSAGCGCGK